MKKTLTFAFAALLCLFALSVESPAQDYVATPVTVSKDKVKQNGKLYYAHIVLEKQTLFSIAKAYGVTVDEIYEANSGLRENGLKTNSIILIPAESGSAAAASAESSASEENQSSSTAQSAAEQSSETATTSDTGASGKSRKSSAKTSKNRQDYFIHTVKWYEDIDMISAKYGVSTEIIMRANGLTSKKLKSKQQLKIPTNPEEYEVTGELPGSEKSQSAATSRTTGSTSDQTSAESSEGQSSTQETSSSEPDQSSWEQSSGQSAWGGAASESQSSSFSGRFPTFRNMNRVNAMLMLPFNASGNPNEVSMDFYSGALLAAKNLSDEGLELNLGVYDTYGDVIPVTMDNISSTDFIIGLLSANGFSSLLGSVPTGTFVVSPLDARTESLTESNSNFIQCSNSTAAQYEDLARWIGEDMQPGDSVVVIYENTIAGQDLKNSLSQILSRYSYKWSSFSYTILQGRNITKPLSAHLNPDATNRILIASENEAFVNDVVRNLNLLIHSKYEIILYGGSKIRSFENVDVANLHNTNFHSSLSYYIDYDNPKVREFLMQYRALYNTEPSQTAFQGYDTLYYFATMMKRRTDPEDYMVGKSTPMLMSDFQFERSGLGLSRTAVRRIIYQPDFSVTYIK